MYIFGHRFIENENFYHIQSVDAIENTPPSCVVYIEFSEQNIDIIKHMQLNQLPFALGAEDITQIIYASSLGASYIMVTRSLAKNAQSLANNYLFDAKILIHIEEEDEIENLALLGVDGVIFSNAIIKTNS